jgi:hypothetical protein
MFLTHRIAQQHAGQTVHLSAQFIRCAHVADIVWHADELIQRRIQSVKVTGQPVADERQQLAQLDRLASVKAPKETNPRFRHGRQAYLS